MFRLIFLISTIVSTLGLARCASDRVTALHIIPVQPQPGDEAAGGLATVHDVSPEAFALPLPKLDRAQRRAFAVGNSFFNDPWVVAPASTLGRDGLGPLFNATNCSGCHFRDGRGRPPELVGDPLASMLIRLSVPNGPGRTGPILSTVNNFRTRRSPVSRQRATCGLPMTRFTASTLMALGSPCANRTSR